MYTKIKSKEIFEYIYNIIVLFFFIFEMPICGIITTRRLSILIVILTIFIKRDEYGGIWNCIKKKDILITSIGLLICFIISVFNDIKFKNLYNPENSYFRPHYIIYLFLYIIVFAIYCAVEYKSIEQFSDTLSAIMIFQSIVVCISIISFDFRMFIYNNFYFGDDRFIKDNSLIRGSRGFGIALHSSTGSIILCTACIVLTFLAIEKRISIKKYLTSALIIMAGTFFVGRLGFAIELFLLGLYFIMSDIKLKDKLLGLLTLTVVFLLLITVILNVINSDVANQVKRWTGELFNSETRFNTINILNNMKYPKYFKEMVFGTNITFGVMPDGQIMESDIGYIKTYTALGIVGMISYYGSFLYMYISSIRNMHNKKRILYFSIITLIIFVIEYKEPFIQKYIFSFVIFAAILFILKQECEDKYNKDKVFEENVKKTHNRYFKFK